MKLQSVDTRDAAAMFKDYLVYIRRDNRPDLSQNEFMVRDLVGLRVAVGGAVVGEIVGVVLPSDLCESAAIASKMHSLLEVKLTSSKKLTLVPFVPSVVTGVDLSSRQVTVDPPVGLLDLTYEESKRVVIRGFLPEVASIMPEVRRWLEAVYPVSYEFTARCRPQPPQNPSLSKRSNRKHILLRKK